MTDGDPGLEAGEADAGRFTLYYWPVPFRGQFVRAVLANAGFGWTEGGAGAIAGWMDGPMRAMPVPFMGPPVLVDGAAGFAIAQMPAIVLYLGDMLGLLPGSAAMRALTMKVVSDANDVIDDVTLQGGVKMWTATRWEVFLPRLVRWMSLWEDTGRRHGLSIADGFLLGGPAPGIADVVTATLWTTMGDRFPTIAAMLEAEAPLTAGLCRRMSEVPALGMLAAAARRDYGDAYCGGEIEVSLRKVLGM